jgi:hypothetical protein
MTTHTHDSWQWGRAGFLPMNKTLAEVNALLEATEEVTDDNKN